MSANIFEQKLLVQNYQSDPTNHLAIPMIVNMAISASTAQAEEKNISMDLMHDVGLGWVLLQYDIHINKRPKFGEEVIIKTQAKEIDKYFARRMFWIEDLNQNTLIEIDSLWAMIDMKKRKMIQLDKRFTEPLGADVLSKIEKPNKPNQDLFDEKEAETFVKKYQVRFFDIDTNQHVNNSRYFDWMIDPLDFDFLMTHEPVNLRLRYAKEVLVNSVVEAKVVLNEKKDKSNHVIMVDGNLFATGEVQWKEKK